jgi:hypothetical protein
MTSIQYYYRTLLLLQGDRDLLLQVAVTGLLLLMVQNLDCSSPL